MQIDDYSLVQFLPLDITDEDSVTELLLYIDNTIQYGEDLDVKIPKVCCPQDYLIFTEYIYMYMWSDHPLGGIDI